MPQVLVVHAAVADGPLFLLVLAIKDSFFMIEALLHSGQRISFMAEALKSSSSNGCPQSSQTNS
jgi:hypothetical protein